MTETAPTPDSVGSIADGTFRAIWPVVDETVPWNQLIREAIGDVPMVAIRARAFITGDGTFRLEPSSKIAGSGNSTPFCLVFEAPARPAPHRDYHFPRSA